MIYAADIETTGLLEDLMKQETPLLHNFGFKAVDGTEILFSRNIQSLNILDNPCADVRDMSGLQAFLDTGPTLIMHNGLCYDGEALEFFGYDLSKVKIIDSLYLAWYLEPTRNRYGLAEYGEEFGVPKPVIENWENQTQSEYNFRVMQDCRIQLKLWGKLWRMAHSLYEGDQTAIWRMIHYINGKGVQLRNQQRTKWLLNEEGSKSLHAKLVEEKEEKFKELVEVMPRKVVYKTYKMPANPFKASGALSVHGVKWMAFCMKYGLDFGSTDIYKYPSGDVEGNPNSSDQVKDWLFSLGWEPQTWEYKRNEEGTERKIPQVNIKNSGGKLDPGIELLIMAGHHSLKKLQGLGIIKHRESLVKGWLENVREGKLTARSAGFTNTLRMRHAELVNIPSTRVLFGEEIRDQLCAAAGWQLLGSDLSSLEDKCKHHYQIPLDPEYVASQGQSDFDPHLEICRLAGLLTPEQIKAHKEKREDHSKIRALGKTCNYACQYGAGAPTIARQAKISLELATQLHAAYWELNWSIKKIAESTTVKNCNGVTWQWNPVSKLWYYLKTKKDRFSTLCQGTGAFVFDIWISQLFKICKERYGREPMMNGQFHDEIILTLKEGEAHQKLWKALVLEAIDKANEILQMRKEIACDIQFGPTYAHIH